MKTTEFTKEQIENWRSFERVRKGGKWNMFDQRSRKASGLSQEEYTFCMRNYSPLKAEAESPA